MFGLDTTVLAMVVLAGLSAGAVAYAFMFNSIADEQKADRRLNAVKTAETDQTVDRKSVV